MEKKEDKVLGTRAFKILLSKLLLHTIPSFISMVPFFAYISIEIQTFNFDINNVQVLHSSQ